MNSFHNNNIITDLDYVAAKLKKARTKKKLSLEDIAKKTNINSFYLMAFEEANVEKLPPSIYSKNILKEYSEMLGLNSGEFLEIFESETTHKKTKKEELFSQKVVGSNRFFTIPKILKNTAILGVVMICFMYLVGSLEKIVAPPYLAVNYPPDNIVVEEKAVEIKGETDDDANIEINGEAILLDGEGKFEKKVSLKKGINEILIVAKKNYGQDNVIKKQIMVK